MTFLNIISQDESLKILLSMCSFFLLGASTKYVDDAFDENIFSKLTASLLLPPMAFLWGYTMSVSIPAAVILSGIMLGALATGKVNNLAFGLGFVIAGLAFYTFGSMQTLETNIVSILLIGTMGAADEIANDFMDKRRSQFVSTKFMQILSLFLTYRFLKKIIILIVVIINSFPLIYFFSFLLQSIGYVIVGKLGERLKLLSVANQPVMRSSMLGT